MKEYLKTHNLSISMFSRMVGCSSVTISKALQGKGISKSIAAKIYTITKGEVDLPISNRGRKKGFVVENPKPFKKHDLSSSKEYKIWSRIKMCCYTPSYCQYKSYGARGVVMCDRWKESVEAFVEDMGRIPKGYKSLILDADSYEFKKETCSWCYDARGLRREARKRVKIKKTCKDTKTRKEIKKDPFKPIQIQFDENMRIFEE